jgi:glycosyltransferase involved in cell wall biosynthesis
MRVALVGSYPERDAAPVGGVEVATWRLSRALHEAGVDVTVVATRGSGEDAAASGVQVIRLGVDDRWSAIRDLRPLRGALADTLETVAPDVVHAEDLVPAGYAAARVAVAGRPTIVTAHGNRRHDTMAAYRGADAQLRWLLGRRMARRAAESADVVIGVHPDPALSVPASPRRFEFIPNIVESSFFTVVRQPDGLQVLYAGGPRRIKGGDVLFAAWPAVVERIPQARLLAPGCAAAVRALSADMARTIAAPPWLDGDRFLNALARSSVLAIPSRFELAPIALAEAWAARVPVVATDVGGVPAIARGAARLVAANVPGELAAAIVEALTDTRGNAQLVGEGNRRAQMQRADSVVSAHLRLYEDLCER